MARGVRRFIYKVPRSHMLKLHSMCVPEVYEPWILAVERKQVDSTIFPYALGDPRCNRFQILTF